MSKLKITEGEWYSLEKGKSTGWSVQIKHDGQLCEIFNKDHAELIADAGNTYQKCGLLPSELLEKVKLSGLGANFLSDDIKKLQQENQELREALRKIFDNAGEWDSLKQDYKSRLIAEKALTKEK